VDRLRSIANDEELGYLIPPSLLAFLVGGLPAEKKATVSNVSLSPLKAFLGKTAAPQYTKPELRKLAHDAFPGRRITDRLFNEAYVALPAAQKRAQGDTDRRRLKTR
jgi:hypothetical protein